ncbi:hypothetical protein DL89DRAFT_93457 [Linderina pennispora]|uniref:Uncharacterized protein n=1 Tax=Linderina pennispora TaxID=61395 RepID=A0A1Y1VQY9_9FUNG|nr:uncharacterized protein DL89DRAFT_93457 [Linderina pennispora]ORX63446.1 hypothetical protein DL89DRAFT_93457 [Linderina pennispora]
MIKSVLSALYARWNSLLSPYLAATCFLSLALFVQHIRMVPQILEEQLLSRVFTIALLHHVHVVQRTFKVLAAHDTVQTFVSIPKLLHSWNALGELGEVSDDNLDINDGLGSKARDAVEPTCSTSRM